MKTIVFTIVSLFASLSFARSYGEAGCGLGTIVMGKDGNQVLAATTNGTSGNQTFGITSGTSNCTDGGSVADSKQIPMFIEVNKITLAKEAARGEGDVVAGLAQLMGCNTKNFGSALKSNYNKIFVESNMQPTAIQNNISNIVNANRTATCGA